MPTIQDKLGLARQAHHARRVYAPKPTRAGFMISTPKAWPSRAERSKSTLLARWDIRYFARQLPALLSIHLKLYKLHRALELAAK